MKILYAHWGLEEKHQIVEDQMRLARMAIDAGFDAVVGCHGHVIQPYEEYKGKPIFYGLGNFIFGDIPNKIADKDGNLTHRVKKLRQANKQSMVPVFDLSAGVLKVKEVEFYELKDSGVSRIQESDLTFNLAAENAVVKAYADYYSHALEVSSPVKFETYYENNYFGHYYSSRLVAPIGGGTKFKNGVRKIWRPFYRLTLKLRGK